MKSITSNSELEARVDLLRPKIMAAAGVSELESKYQDLASATEKLADGLTKLQHRSQKLMKFRAFQPQESRDLTFSLCDTIDSVEAFDPQGWLHGMRSRLLTGRDYAIDIISLRKPGQGPLVRTIELLQTAENRAEEYKRTVSEQSLECTSTFARATSNKYTSDSLARHINDCQDRTFADIGRVNKKLSSSMRELEENKKSLRVFHMIEDDAQRKEKRWKKIHKWTKPLVVIYPVTKVVCWLKEDDVEAASAWIKDAELEVQQVQEERDRINTQLAALRSTVDRGSELSSQNNDLCDVSKRMMQQCKELAVEAEHMRNSARQALMRLSAINDQMMILSKMRHGDLEEQKDHIKKTLLSIQAAIEPIVMGRRLCDTEIATMLMLDCTQREAPLLDSGIGGL